MHISGKYEPLLLVGVVLALTSPRSARRLAPTGWPRRLLVGVAVPLELVPLAWWTLAAAADPHPTTAVSSSSCLVDAGAPPALPGAVPILPRFERQALPSCPVSRWPLPARSLRQREARPLRGTESSSVSSARTGASVPGAARYPPASAVAGGNTTGVCPRWAAVLGGRWGRWGGLLSGCPRSLTLAAAWRWCAPTDCDGLPGAGSDPSSVCESATSSFRPGAPWLRGLSVGAAGDGVPDRGRRPVQPQIGWGGERTDGGGRRGRGRPGSRRPTVKFQMGAGRSGLAMEQAPPEVRAKSHKGRPSKGGRRKDVMEATDEAGEYWIYTGEGEVPDDVTHVRVSDDVTVLRTRAFYRRERLVAVQLHEGLVEVGNEAFSSCTSLECVRIPSSVTTVGAYAFGKCSKLRHVEFPEDSRVGAIMDCAFQECV
ncbi:hypothetical protein THAOC_25629, partial [Thalassiosira oceanica]